VIGNTSVVATRASLSRSFVYNIISAVFELRFTRVTSILKAKKSKGHSLLGFKLQANLYSLGFQQFLLSSSSFVLRSSIH
jgi:hypothetical protein